MSHVWYQTDFPRSHHIHVTWTRRISHMSAPVKNQGFNMVVQRILRAFRNWQPNSNMIFHYKLMLKYKLFTWKSNKIQTAQIGCILNSRHLTHIAGIGSRIKKTYVEFCRSLRLFQVSNPHTLLLHPVQNRQKENQNIIFFCFQFNPHRYHPLRFSKWTTVWYLFWFQWLA